MEAGRKKRHLFSLFLSLSILHLLFVVNLELATAASRVPDFYYYYTEKISLNVSTEMITICFQETTGKQEKETLIKADPILKDISNEGLPSGLVLIVTKEGLGKEDIT